MLFKSENVSTDTWAFVASMEKHSWWVGCKSVGCFTGRAGGEERGRHPRHTSSCGLQQDREERSGTPWPSCSRPLRLLFGFWRYFQLTDTKSHFRRQAGPAKDFSRVLHACENTAEIFLASVGSSKVNVKSLKKLVLLSVRFLLSLSKPFSKSVFMQ